MNSVHIGDDNVTYGDNSPIITMRSAGPGTEVALQDLVHAVQVMRNRVSPGPARQIADEFLELADSPGKLERHRLRDALLRIGTVATMAGQVGVPVIDAVEKLKGALGL